uniref:RING-type domain-containing protein n=1 Tax=viral metagenome TaxID=1070528 RepID=A0A6C0JGI1_9ZZZZ
MDSYFSEIQQEIERVMQNMNRERGNNSRSRSANPTRNATPSSNGGNSEFLSLLRELLYVYNNNIRDYQDNTRMMLQAILLIITNNNNQQQQQQQQQQNPFRRSANRWNSRELDNFIYYMIYPTGTIPPVNTPLQENVVVAPTQQQIDAATINYNFHLESAQSNTTCPITLEEFSDNDPVCRIRHCGHTFRHSAIQNWFRSNVRCPVCRFDIRDHIENNSQLPENNNTNSVLQDRIRELIGEYINMDNSQNQFFSFDLPPFLVQDSSFNFIHQV